MAHNEPRFNLIDLSIATSTTISREVPPKVRLHVHAVKNPAGQVPINGPHESQMLQVDAAQHYIRNHVEDGKIDTPSARAVR